jgi:hypothetical protein
MQKKRKNLSNWTKGLYPLYKNPFGITEKDRIIGIDPGMKNSMIFDIVITVLHIKASAILSVVLAVILKILQTS